MKDTNGWREDSEICFFEREFRDGTLGDSQMPSQPSPRDGESQRDGRFLEPY